jgi:hypothetical protein
MSGKNIDSIGEESLNHSVEAKEGHKKSCGQPRDVLHCQDVAIMRHYDAVHPCPKNDGMRCVKQAWLCILALIHGACKRYSPNQND